MPDQLVCPACGRRLQFTSNFCPECGADLNESERRAERTDPAPIKIPPPPTQGITVEFPFSASQALDFAIREARKQVTFAKFGDGKKAVYRVTYDKTQMPAVINLIEYLKGRRLRTVYLDGEKVPWKSVFQFAWCLEMKKRSFRPQYYCLGYNRRERQLNIWGCIHSGLYLFPYAPWHCWGRFVDDKGTWCFDKKRFGEEIQKSLYLYRFCPELDLQMIQDLLKAFPEQVNPNRDKNWEFVEKWGVSLEMRYPFTGKKLPSMVNGVRPRGLGFLQEMGRHLTRRLSWMQGGDP